MEAALQGLPAMALSQFYGPDNRSLDNPFEAAAMHGAALVEKLLHNDMWDRGDYHSFLNINFPPVPARAVKGPRIVAQGYRKETFFGVEPHHAPSGRKFLWIKGGPQDLPTAPDTDVRANLEGYISVTPMRCDLTAHDLIAPLRDLMG
jgi:5'-nucleotidase